ncbi:hypothetical protein HHK36_014980 [Tetracentron sinense]|uniref:VQ domain-containing protein n=1 Tax=Tetracentron sinense TaxID=13715 RepID=A0A834Z3W6_TETSI|nr:hypothetical protein HHK36_014980 [Tetracentron sinense]
MSPSQLHGEQRPRKEINGSRPSPLKINNDSHLIQKSTSSSSSSNSSSSLNGVATKQRSSTHQQQRHPVIIYTHSPKIIHTQARDFMALVQKLTGISRSDDHQESKSQSRQASPEENCNKVKSDGHDHETESSSVVTDENCGAAGVGDFQVSSSSVSPIFDRRPNPYFADIPLFTPNSTDFFCSPQPFYRYPDSVFMSPNMGNSISPSVLEVMKGYPDY